MNFDPHIDESSCDASCAPTQHTSCQVAVSSIVDAIVQGSGGPDNSEMSEHGLRFVRHILASSRLTRFGFMPNFKNMEVVQALARDFIRNCGDSTIALQAMHTVTQCE